MDKRALDWKVGYMSSDADIPEEWMEAKVPGAVQLDYAAAHGWELWYQGTNVRDYAWMEDVYWLYRAPLRFDLKPGEKASLVFTAIDYKYQIRVGGEVLFDGEGMFSEVRCDVTKFSGHDTFVEVLIWPVPKSDDSNTRDQANHSCKAAACYGWDWHPRLVTSGIWDETYLLIEDHTAVEKLDVSYTLSDSLDRCDLHITALTGASCPVTLRVHDGERLLVEQIVFAENGVCRFEAAISRPKLWYPVGYGQQPLYTVTVTSGTESKSRKVGFRRSKFVMNEGSWAVIGYPKSRAAAPATLEINGVRVFAKGSNWVNATVFPGEMNEAHYRSLLEQALDANMNIMRIWGGGFVNKESFFEICDELGIMVWQEFPLACNEYPDDDDYLKVLENEAVNIVRRLRTHPCVVMWCGGNELFNSWSGMTEQHHALRLLDHICYTEDRYTPFIMTSPLNGMAHGPYVNYNEFTKEELITSIRSHYDTAYTEFGAPAMSSRDVLLTFMDEAEIAHCDASSDIWTVHFGFDAGTIPSSWVRMPEFTYYFGGWTDTDDMIRKSQFLQAMSYRSVFEEARMQWPHCSMVVNWCWNEPWPCAGNCSVLAWPDVPKAAHGAIRQALRPQASALRVDRHLWNAGTEFSAEVWLLNDSGNTLPAGSVTVEYDFGDGWITWGTLSNREVPPRRNGKLGVFSAPIPHDFDGFLRIRISVEGSPDLNSEYTYICRCKKTVKKKMLNVDW